ncbi:MAG: PadR family transcriptional regulator [Actinobacteria bacterium]|nr:PadR family transcriptional regulator [Actinomycetota bacterium]
MSTRHVILGLIREQPGHTYDVAVRFGRRLGPWKVNRGQVYRTVAALESDGLIEQADEPVPSARSGPVWRITGDGAAEFTRWFATRSEEVEPMRGELLAKLAVARPRDARELLHAIDWYQRALTFQLDVDLEARQSLKACAGSDTREDWERELADSLADYAIIHRDSELNWLTRARGMVERWIADGVANDAYEGVVQRTRVG